MKKRGEILFLLDIHLFFMGKYGVILINFKKIR